MPSKKVEFSDIKTDVYRYPNIKTCKLKDKVNPNLEINLPIISSKKNIRI